MKRTLIILFLFVSLFPVFGYSNNQNLLSVGGGYSITSLEIENTKYTFSGVDVSLTTLMKLKNSNITLIVDDTFAFPTFNRVSGIKTDAFSFSFVTEMLTGIGYDFSFNKDQIHLILGGGLHFGLLTARYTASYSSLSILMAGLGVFADFQFYLTKDIYLELIGNFALDFIKTNFSSYSKITNLPLNGSIKLAIGFNLPTVRYSVRVN